MNSIRKTEKKDFNYIEIEKLFVSEGNIRKLEIEAASLIPSIKRNGIKKPLDVYEEGDRFGIIDGQRRYLACLKIIKDNLSPEIVQRIMKLPCVVHRDVKTISQAQEFSLTDVLLKKDINPLDKAKAIREEIKKLGTLKEVSEKYGIPLSTLSQCISLNNLHPDLQKRLGSTCGNNEKLPLRKAYEVARFPQDKQIEIAGKILPLKDPEMREVLRREKGTIESKKSGGSPQNEVKVNELTVYQLIFQGTTPRETASVDELFSAYIKDLKMLREVK